MKELSPASADDTFAEVDSYYPLYGIDLGANDPINANKPLWQRLNRLGKSPHTLRLRLRPEHIEKQWFYRTTACVASTSDGVHEINPEI